MFKEFPTELVFVFLAIGGGIARYLNGYTNGIPFNLGMFAASSAVSGFSGLMFSFLGNSMGFPLQIVYIMAGTGGFMGDQTMKFLFEYFKKKTV